MKESSIRLVLKSSLLILMVLAISSCGVERGKKIEKGVINADTTWSKEIFVTGDVEIAPGVTLTIMPGTTVRFAKIEADGPLNLHETKENNFSRAELIVRGTVIAKGLKERKIVFTSAERSPKPGDWGAINFLDSTGNSFEYCEISYADTGVHGHGVNVDLKNCYVHHNGVGVAYNNKPGFKTKSSVGVHNNRIVGNGGGILCGRQTVSRIGHNQIANNELYGVFGKGASSSQVRYNNISHNGKGVILYATRGFRVNENNISENEGYAISLLEGQIYDVDARKNWWGSKDKEKIREFIWDKVEDRTLGRVNFSGFAGSPIEEAGLSG